MSKQKLEYQSQLNEEQNNLYDIIITAIISQDLDLLRESLESETTPQIINIKDSFNKETLLHLATDYNDIEAAELLLKYGSDVNQIDNNGATALFNAVESENIAMIKLLLEYDINPEIGSDSFVGTIIDYAANFLKNDEITSLFQKELKELEPQSKTEQTYVDKISAKPNQDCTNKSHTR